MPSCERCWVEAQRWNIEYQEQLRRAEVNGEPCVQNTPEGAKLRAGQFWDEKLQRDRRYDGT